MAWVSSTAIKAGGQLGWGEGGRHRTPSRRQARLGTVLEAGEVTVDRTRPAAVEAVTNAWIVAVLAPLRARLPRWPAVLPNAVGDPIKPLKIGISQELLELLPAEDQPAGRKLLNVVLGRYCNSRQYLAAVAAAQAMRYDLDGHPVEPVADQHKTKPAWAQAKRSRGRSTAAASVEPAAGTVEFPQEDVVVTVRVKALKVAVVIPPEQLPPVAPGAEVVLQVEAGAVTATARLNPKAYRKALATIAEQGAAQVAMVVQGQMTTPGVIDAAGITVRPRPPKGEKPPPGAAQTPGVQGTAPSRAGARH